MDFHSIGIDFTKNPELFADLQNKDDDFLMDIDAKLMKAFRFPFVFFLTCDRAEVIAEGSPEFGVLERALSLNPAETSQYRYSVQYAEERLFLLSSGILSPLFGEDTIQGQLLKGLECARLMGTASSALDKLFLMAVSFSKRIHTEMKLRVFDRCIGTEIMKRLEGISSVLIVGSGEWARELASMLSAHFDVSMTLRDIGKTFLVPPGVEAVPYDDRRLYAADSDAVISVTCSAGETITLTGALPSDDNPFDIMITSDSGMEEVVGGESSESGTMIITYPVTENGTYMISSAYGNPVSIYQIAVE